MPRTSAVRPVAWAAGLFCLTCLSSCQPTAGRGRIAGGLPAVGDFTLTERGGRVVHASDLAGKVWVASFIFTRCTGPCPHVTATMAAATGRLRRRRRTCASSHSPSIRSMTPRKSSGSTPTSGEPTPSAGCSSPATRRTSTACWRRGSTSASRKTPRRRLGESVTHDTHLAVVDQRGRVRGYFPGAASPDDARFGRRAGSRRAPACARK